MAGESSGPRGGGRGQWTLRSAAEILSDVRGRTERAHSEYEPLLRKRESQEIGSPGRVEAEQAMRRCLSRWVREMEALGVVVRGLWRVDFVGEGVCFPWEWPEQELLYAREPRAEGTGDDAEEDERVRIQ